RSNLQKGADKPRRGQARVQPTADPGEMKEQASVQAIPNPDNRHSKDSLCETV
ncbi:hypothetical protein BaRGS_00015873, partial [Batillaria attramentaria]